jgi:hypothetical protein
MAAKSDVQSTYTPVASARDRHDLVDENRDMRPLRSRAPPVPGIVLGKRLALELAQEPIVVPDLEVLRLAQHVDVPGHAGGITQALRNQHAPCASNSPTWP